MMVSTFAVATAHAFVLTVSHGLLFRQPPFTATARLPPILFEFTRFHRAAARRSKFRNLNLRSLTKPSRCIGKLFLARELRAGRTHESVTI
jgi:hypothetical protein